VQPIYRVPWGDFPDVVIHTNVPTLRAHPAYQQAKLGDPDSALQVASKFVKATKVSLDFDVIVPVVQTDARKHNGIPAAAAFILGDRLNKQVIDNVFQTNEVSHTAASSSGRLLGQPSFAGVVPPGARALILDDVVTLGSTLANLRGWIQHCGATVVASTCLAAGFGATKLIPPASIREELDRCHPTHHELANRLGFDSSCWTNRESRFLLTQSSTTLSELLSTARSLYPSRAETLERLRMNEQGRGQEPPSPEPPAPPGSPRRSPDR
jgi:orotate phosphoribosyltransferase-like protein